MISKERALRALETAKRIKDPEAIANIEALLITLQENENVSRNLAPRRDPGAFENITSGFGAKRGHFGRQCGGRPQGDSCCVATIERICIAKRKFFDIESALTKLDAKAVL